MTTTAAGVATDVEPVEEFRLRARAWLQENFPKETALDAWPPIGDTDEEVLAAVNRARENQRKLFDGGFAGVCFPKEYGGRGLTPQHQQALAEKDVGYAIPRARQIPSFVPCAAVLLEFGTDEQKQRHLPAILRGDEIWMQLLSEPSGGSDVAGAGALTTAGARRCRLGSQRLEGVDQRGMVRRLRTVPRAHQLGCSQTPGTHRVHRGPQGAGRRGPAIGDDQRLAGVLSGVLHRRAAVGFDRVGEADDGWTVGTRWMFTRKRTWRCSPYVTGGVLVTAFENADRINLEIAGATMTSTIRRRWNSSANRTCSTSPAGRCWNGSWQAWVRVRSPTPPPP